MTTEQQQFARALVHQLWHHGWSLAEITAALVVEHHHGLLQATAPTWLVKSQTLRLNLPNLWNLDAYGRCMDAALRCLDPDVAEELDSAPSWRDFAATITKAQQAPTPEQTAWPN